MTNHYGAYHVQRGIKLDRILRANAERTTKDETPVETFAEYKARKAAERKTNVDDDDDEEE